MPIDNNGRITVSTPTDQLMVALEFISKHPEVEQAVVLLGYKVPEGEGNSYKLAVFATGDAWVSRGIVEHAIEQYL